MPSEGLREEGIEPLALASYVATIGTSGPIAPHANLDELVDAFDFAKLSRAPARFDPAELRALNAKLLHMLPFDAVAARLRAIGVGGGEAFWEAVRGNLAVLGDSKIWWGVVQAPLQPVISDAALCARRRGCCRPSLGTSTTWERLVGCGQAGDRRQGQGAVPALRLALTGREHGPELKQLLPLIGRARAGAARRQDA